MKKRKKKKIRIVEKRCFEFHFEIRRCLELHSILWCTHTHTVCTHSRSKWSEYRTASTRIRAMFVFRWVGVIWNVIAIRMNASLVNRSANYSQLKSLRRLRCDIAVRFAGDFASSTISVKQQKESQTLERPVVGCLCDVRALKLKRIRFHRQSFGRALKRNWHFPVPESATFPTRLMLVGSLVCARVRFCVHAVLFFALVSNAFVYI